MITKSVRRMIFNKGSIPFCSVVVGLGLVLSTEIAQAAHPAGHPSNAVAVGNSYQFNTFDSTLFGGGGGALPGGNYFGGPCASGSVAGGSIWACWFFDGRIAGDSWSWETAIHNPNFAFLDNNAADPALNGGVPIGFYYAGGPVLGNLWLGADSTFHIQIPVNDALYGEAGWRRIWYWWKHPLTIHVDAGVYEVPGVPPTNWHFHTDPADNFVEDGSIDPSTLAFSISDPTYQSWVDQNLGPEPVPLPAAVWLFGSGIAGLFALARRRRRSA